MPDDQTLSAAVMCGSLPRGSHNAALARALPSLAPADLVITPAPPFDSIPHYNHDIQDGQGFPETVTRLADAIRDADGLIIVSPEYTGPFRAH